MMDTPQRLKAGGKGGERAGWKRKRNLGIWFCRYFRRLQAPKWTTIALAMIVMQKLQCSQGNQPSLPTSSGLLGVSLALGG